MYNPFTQKNQLVGVGFNRFTAVLVQKKYIKQTNIKTEYFFQMCHYCQKEVLGLLTKVFFTSGNRSLAIMQTGRQTHRHTDKHCGY